LGAFASQAIPHRWPHTLFWTVVAYGHLGFLSTLVELALHALLASARRWFDATLRPLVPHSSESSMADSKLIHAFTALGADAPPYINVSRMPDGAVRVVIRGAVWPNGTSGTEEITLPAEEWSR